MKKYIVIFLLFLLVLMGATNPTKDQYISWSKEMLKENAGSDLVNIGVDIFGSTLIESSTKGTNFIFFSLFETNIMNTPMKTVGLFHNFILISYADLNAGDVFNLNDQQINEENKQQEDSSDLVDFSDEIFILGVNGKSVNKTVKWSHDLGLERRELDIIFKDKEGKLVIGRDTPNGYRFHIFIDDFGNRLDLEDWDNFAFDEYGEIYDTHSIQASFYDFNNDGNMEIIIAIGDGYLTGKFWVYSYTSVTDVTKVNPFTLELSEYFQSAIIIEENKIYVPIGSQGLHEEYAWFEDGFYRK